MTSTRINGFRLAGLRVLAGLVLALSIMPLVGGPVPTARAVEQVAPSPRDPVARVLVHLSRVNVSTDYDWGAGDISMDVRVNEYKKDCEGAGCVRTLVSGHVRDFQASDESITTVDRVVPRYGDAIKDPAINSAIGIPIRLGYSYELVIVGLETDPAQDDLFGTVNDTFADAAGNVRLGPAIGRSRHACSETPIDGDPSCEDNSPGVYTLDYEIVPASLPDLHPTSIKVYDLLGSPTKLVCTTVKNEGIDAAGPFELALKLSGVETAGGRTQAGRLGVNETGDLCVEVVLPTAGSHELTAIVDFTGNQIEFNEANNVYRQAYSPAGLVSESDSQESSGGAAAEPDQSATPTPSPSPASAPTRSEKGQADLVISTVRVNSQVPDGKSDCKDGKNAVAVVVKNDGSGKAGEFVVQLTIDGDEATEKPAAGLEAGQEREVRFDDVRLKKGEHKLTATVDPEGAVAESKDDNNALKVTVGCTAAN